ncbi:protein dispatched homolog 1-like [Amphiura filiformis]|uniref:protein dispatched homolog 1-like n=1 Tax=Amphiura filiformis TaxID=82378 RepID=UPI003B2157A3
MDIFRHNADNLDINTENHQQYDQRRGCYYWYALILSRYSVAVFFTILLLSIACIATVFALHGFPNFDDPIEGFEASQTPIHSRLIALENYFSSDLLLDKPRNYRRFDDTFSTSSTNRQRRQTGDGTGREFTGFNTCDMVHLGDFAKLVFESSRGNPVFSKHGIESMCEIEQKTIRTHPEFSTSCYQCGLSNTTGSCHASWSLGTYVSLLYNRASCKAITSIDIFNARKMLQRCASYYNNGTLCEKSPCEFEAEAPEECFQFDAAYNIFNFLTPADFATGIQINVNTELKYVNHILPIKINAHTDQLVSIYIDKFHKKTFTDNYVVLKALDFGVETKFDLFGIFILRDFIFVGVGLVCVFLVIWVYTGSLFITLGSCLTVLLSFLLSYFLYFVVFRQEFFPFVNVVSVILLIGVGADDTFVFVDLWRKSLSQNEGADLHVIVQKTLHHATLTMLVTSVTTACSLYASIISNIIAVKCFGLFAGTAIMVNFFLTLTLLPAIIIMHHHLKQKCSISCSKNAKGIWKTYGSLVRICYQNTLHTLVLKLRIMRYVWLIIFGALGIGGILVVFKYPGLQLPSSSEFQIFTDDNYLEQWDTKYKNTFSGQNQQYLNGIVVFGVKSVDNSDPWVPERRGKLVFDTSFEFSSKEHQNWMLELCRRIRNQQFHHPEDTRKCFIELLMDYMNRPCVNASTGSILSPCCTQNPFPYEQQVLDICLRTCTAVGYCSNGVHYNSNDDSLSALSIEFTSSRTITHGYHIIEEYWRNTNEWFEEQISGAPDTLKGGWFISYLYEEGDQLYFYDLQRSLAQGTPIALGITLAIVLVILIFTILHIVLACYALLTIGFAVFVTVGSLVLLGWELNIFEAIVITLSVGLCVDLTIHYGVAYRVAPRALETREERTYFSIQTMSGAITAAALSTFLAGVFMLAANINAYFQLGLFLVFVMTISWTYATFFFQSLCAVAGPQRNCGDLTSFNCCKSSCLVDVNEEDKGALPIPQRNGSHFAHGPPINVHTTFMGTQSFSNSMFNDNIDLGMSVNDDLTSTTTGNAKTRVVRNPAHGKKIRAPAMSRIDEGSRNPDFINHGNDLPEHRASVTNDFNDLPEESVFSGVNQWLSANEAMASSNPAHAESNPNLANPPQAHGFKTSNGSSNSTVRAVMNPTHTISSNWYFKPEPERDLKKTSGSRRYRVSQHY